MRTVRLLIGFDGTRYEGWQDQKKGNTLQEVLQKAIEKIFSVKLHLTSSSRTDSGVHAKGLVAHFKVKSALPDTKIKDALNFHLPKDIVVFLAATVADDFHARFDAKSKIYEYVIWNSPTRPLFEAPYVLWYPQPLDPALMRRAAKTLLGKHDFKAFRDKGDDRTTVRRIQKVTITKKAPLIRIRVQGDGFLTHMVRIIAGTLIEVGRGKMAPQDLSRILKSKDRKQAGPTAKALGLTLLEVLY